MHGRAVTHSGACGSGQLQGQGMGRWAGMGVSGLRAHLHRLECLSELRICRQRLAPAGSIAAAAAAAAACWRCRAGKRAIAVAAAGAAAALGRCAGLSRGVVLHLCPRWVQQLVSQRAQHHVRPLRHKEDVALQVAEPREGRGPRVGESWDGGRCVVGVRVWWAWVGGVGLRVGGDLLRGRPSADKAGAMKGEGSCAPPPRSAPWAGHAARCARCRCSRGPPPSCRGGGGHARVGAGQYAWVS